MIERMIVTIIIRIFRDAEGDSLQCREMSEGQRVAAPVGRRPLHC